jgi:maltose/maltodextrin transport system permease protein
MKPGSRLPQALPALLLAGVVALGLYSVVAVHAAGQGLLALLLLVATALAGWIYTSARTQAARYLFPGLAAALVFVVFPMLYTVAIGFTNQSSTNLLEREQVRALLRAERIPDGDSARAFTLLPAPEGRVRLRLEGAADGNGVAWITAPLALDAAGAEPAAPMEAVLRPAGPADAGSADPLPLRDHVALLPALRTLTLRAPDGGLYSLLSLREFAVSRPMYEDGGEGSLLDARTGTAYQPDEATGFFTSADGQRLHPGYRVGVGLAHYARLFSDERFRAPFAGVLAWTVTFAGLSVVGAAGLGLLLAVLLHWEGLRGRAVYRAVLFLPYAVPGFISILVFKGLFNQNLGEINLILHALFGVKPAWFSDPTLARVMLLIVNVWLGFPYMMVLCSGLIKAIPADLYEASAIAGASPWQNFRRITAPLILKPLTPLLISAFAFNFNNFVLVSLLTGGRPDQLDTDLPAGTTDVLVSYTWRIAFQDSGQQFGLAAAISTVIFAIVAVITLLQMRYTRVAADPAGR